MEPRRQNGRGEEDPDPQEGLPLVHVDVEQDEDEQDSQQAAEQDGAVVDGEWSLYSTSPQITIASSRPFSWK